ncbi:hypothetical protein GCM10020369_06910 [Cryptosporangium minutisporangium]|uniref:Protein kinase domain-containing protein n=1 Tax=Cryptosporangium minutisporangium TaxID=113569 RepID=A0ABP6SQJ3_9ACTN
MHAGDPLRLGRYRMIGRLGEGGQGAVYLGVTEGDERVAVKVLKPDLVADTSARRRFLGEVDLARQVSSFCIAEVLDADLDAERPYIVSEFVEGSSLSEAVTADGPRTGGALHRLAVGTVTALVAIHRAGVVHRDFKPHNVLLGPDGPRVIDFGIARMQDATVTAASGVLGSVSYMSPEQIGGEVVGPPSDVFSWAATVAFAATGRHLFGNDSVPSVLRRILYDPPVLAGLPPALVPILAECLEKDPARRPSASSVLLRLLGHDEQSTDARAIEARVLAETRLSPPPAGREQPTVPFSAPSAPPPESGRRPDPPPPPDGFPPPPPDGFPPPVASVPPSDPVPPGSGVTGPAVAVRRRRRWVWPVAAAVVLLLVAGTAAFLVLRPDGVGGDDRLGRDTVLPSKPPGAAGDLRYRQDFNAQPDWDGYRYAPDTDNPAEVTTRGYDVDRGVYTMLARGEDRSNQAQSPFPPKDTSTPLPDAAFGVTAQVQDRSEGTGELGLTCRGDEDTGTAYLFLLSREGTVRVVRQENGSPTELLPVPARAARIGTSPVRLEAVCRTEGSAAHLTFRVDGEQVVDVRDPNPLPGTTRSQLGLHIRVPDSGDDVLEVSFDDFTVYAAG